MIVVEIIVQRKQSFAKEILLGRGRAVVAAGRKIVHLFE